MDQPTDAETLADLEVRVSELMDDLKVLAIEKLRKLDKAGSGIVQDHRNAAGPWVTPRDFVVAFADEIKWQQSPSRYNQTMAWARRIKNYFTLM